MNQLMFLIRILSKKSRNMPDDAHDFGTGRFRQIACDGTPFVLMCLEANLYQFMRSKRFIQGPDDSPVNTELPYHDNGLQFMRPLPKEVPYVAIHPCSYRYLYFSA
jgi:hypothetical protein